MSERDKAIAAITAKCKFLGLPLPEQIAYVLATADWETNHTFEPVREAYWLSEAWRKRHLSRYYPYYGRGYVQLTWRENYEKYSKLLDIDLVNDPDIALQPDVAAFILVHGFKAGAFTGKKLEDYVNEDKRDYKNARRCINGLDRCQEIAELAENYLESLNE